MKRKLGWVLMICMVLMSAACVRPPDGALPTGHDSSQETKTGNGQAHTPGQENQSTAKLLYMGHASIRITTVAGKVIYIDPYAGDGYEPARISSW